MKKTSNFIVSLVKKPKKWDILHANISFHDLRPPFLRPQTTIISPIGFNAFLAKPSYKLKKSHRLKLIHTLSAWCPPSPEKNTGSPKIFFSSNSYNVTKSIGHEFSSGKVKVDYENLTSELRVKIEVQFSKTSFWTVSKLYFITLQYKTTL